MQAAVDGMRAESGAAGEADVSLEAVDAYRQRVEDRVKVVQAKAAALLDSKENLRKAEDELKAVSAKSASKTQTG